MNRNFLIASILIGVLQILSVSSIELIAYFSQSGLHGELHFTNSITNPKLVKVKAFLEATLQYSEQSWSWGLYNNPIDYSIVDPVERCKRDRVGRELISFDDKLGYLILPGNESSTWNDVDLNLSGENGLWGRSIVMTSGSDRNVRICSTITNKISFNEQNEMEHNAEAKFRKGVTGSMYFRWLKSEKSFNSDLLIYSNLHHYGGADKHLDSSFPTTSAISLFSWKIYATDIFDQTTDRIEENCNVLQTIYDPQNYGPGNSIGDIDDRVGKLRISDKLNVNANQVFQDNQLHLMESDINGPSRKLYVVILDSRNDFLGCAKIRLLKPRVAKSFINSNGIKGELTLIQRSRFEPTWLNFTFAAADGTLQSNFEYAKNIASFKVHNLPPTNLHADYCKTMGDIFEPRHEFNIENYPPPGYGTQDQYYIGDLLGKLSGRNKMDRHKYIIEDGSNELSGIYWDLFLPLAGRHSIVNRGFSLNQFDRSNPQDIKEFPTGCSSFSLYERSKNYQIPMQTLQAQFRYPLVGKILFRQPKEEPWHDTTVIVEYLIHADGSSLNNTDEHEWSIHLHAPNIDYYSWQNRCVSTGDIFNPTKVPTTERCLDDGNKLCRLGDLSRLGTLNIAGGKIDSLRYTRKLFTDDNLPLSGFSNILGKSITIYGKNGPVARGERLGCTRIEGFHPRKIIAKNWHPNGGQLQLKGKVEMYQQSEYEITNVEVSFKDLDDTSWYHIHQTSVEEDLEFPCEDSTLYGQYNPTHINPKLSPLPVVGTTDQYQMGDLSGKYGTLDGLTEYAINYNDTLLPLFGYDNIVGRSVVVHKREKFFRWACSTLERGYSPSEAREIRGIASFHNPLGYAWGYLRMTQLIGNDGSQSDTIIEVKLRHPGDGNRNITRHHNWSVFVNPVSVDATVQQTATRCVAGGYVWNPHYTQLADPLNDELYRQECGRDNPLRCYVGDVSARLGTINIGVDRMIFSDPNFPLEGDISAIGRSIVIYGANTSSERFACANIEPDYDIVKYVNVERPPRFVLSQFIDEVRRVMAIPEWFLHIDSRTTQILHNGACVAFKLHFKGPKAHQLEQDFSKLMSTGQLAEPSLYVPGYVNQKRKKKIAYRICSVRDPNDKKSK
ncbi:hypothetical protein ACKWTF_010504 [Chironomus riparius]